MLLWLIMLLSGAGVERALAVNHTCILKSQAECWSLCDEALTDASYVEGVVLHANVAEFHCLRNIKNIEVSTRGIGEEIAP